MTQSEIARGSQVQASENQNHAIDSLCRNFMSRPSIEYLILSYGLGYVCISYVPKMDNVVESFQPTTFKTLTIPHYNLHQLPQGPKWGEKDELCSL